MWLSESTGRMAIMKQNCCLGIRVPRSAGVFDTSDPHFNAVSALSPSPKPSAVALLEFVVERPPSPEYLSTYMFVQQARLGNDRHMKQGVTRLKHYGPWIW